MSKGVLAATEANALTKGMPSPICQHEGPLSSRGMVPELALEARSSRDLILQEG